MSDESQLVEVVTPINAHRVFAFSMMNLMLAGLLYTWFGWLVPEPNNLVDLVCGYSMGCLVVGMYCLPAMFRE